ncbi:hypothetical protein ABT294_39965 [Nonomuraea sp. NPDC000554]|uniref:hypothetical protein n=1 Tax=Nonomuraea sp. NPDC000554 TaxID=3154259 RepID=UPI003333DE61
MNSGDRFNAFRALADRRGRPGVRLIEALAEAPKQGGGPEEWAPHVARRLGLPAGFYADLSSGHTPAVTSPGRPVTPARPERPGSTRSGSPRPTGWPISPPGEEPDDDHPLILVTEDTAPGQVFCAFHFPPSRVNSLTSGHADTVTSCPEYKVTAVRLAADPG